MANMPLTCADVLDHRQSFSVDGIRFSDFSEGYRRVSYAWWNPSCGRNRTKGVGVELVPLDGGRPSRTRCVVALATRSCSISGVAAVEAPSCGLAPTMGYRECAQFQRRGHSRPRCATTANERVAVQQCCSASEHGPAVRPLTTRVTSHVTIAKGAAISLCGLGVLCCRGAP